MLARSLAVVLIAILAASAVHAADWTLVHRHRTRPASRTGIPDRQYQYLPWSRSEIAISRTAVLLRSRTIEVEALIAATPQEDVSRTEQSIMEIDKIHHGGVLNSSTTRLRVESAEERAPTRLMLPPRTTIIDLYQLDQDGLQIDQCEISQVALQLHDNGVWVLSLRADQNRRPEEVAVPEWNPRLHIKRNEFSVRLRCLGAFQNMAAPSMPATGKPVLVTLEPDTFWVENGQPRYVTSDGRNSRIKDHFADIDRVEIEFLYR